MHRARRATLALALLVALVTTLASPAGAAAPVFWKNFRQPVKVEPTRIDINYATGFAWVAKLAEWEGWGSDRAVSHGVAHINTCNPYCAASNYKAYSATVTLARIGSCKHQRRYLNIKVAIPGKPPAIWGSDCRGAQITTP